MCKKSDLFFWVLQQLHICAFVWSYIYLDVYVPEKRQNQSMYLKRGCVFTLRYAQKNQTSFSASRKPLTLSVQGKSTWSHEHWAAKKLILWWVYSPPSTKCSKCNSNISKPQVRRHWRARRTIPMYLKCRGLCCWEAELFIFYYSHTLNLNWHFSCKDCFI
jgi:hypothetical protein